MNELGQSGFFDLVISEGGCVPTGKVGVVDSGHVSFCSVARSPLVARLTDPH